jgi:hypothetical protein
MGPIQVIKKVVPICALIKTTFDWNVNNKSFQRFLVLLFLFGYNLCYKVRLLGSIYFLERQK